MNLAVIAQGFYAGSDSVLVYADSPDGTLIRLFDDESKVEIGSSELALGRTTIELAEVLFEGQRIIAYVDQFGEKTFGAVIVLQNELENTGWKVPESVNGVPYDEYLEAGGVALPALYSPETCRNLVFDRQNSAKVLSLPLTFNLRILESQGGTVQVSIENISGAVGGFLTRFDGDSIGTDVSKTYSVNGTYQLKIWSADQTEADAITANYSLTMPSAVFEFEDNVVDLYPQMDLGYTGEPGKRVIILNCHCLVPVEFQIDGLFTWEDGIWNSPLGMRANTKVIAAGEYTIRARNKAIPTETISRQIKLVGF